MPEAEQLLHETVEARAKAQRLLDGLIAAKSASERRLADLRQTDLLSRVTGRSSIDNAIESTRRMIEMIDRLLADLRWTLESDRLALE